MLHIVVAPTAPVISKGLALNDLDSFMATPSGEEFVTNFAKALSLKKGELMWVPYGWIAMPACLATLTKGSSSHCEDLAFAIVISVGSKSWAQAEPAHLSAIAAWNRDYLRQVAGKKAWIGSLHGAFSGKFCQRSIWGRRRMRSGVRGEGGSSSQADPHRWAGFNHR